MDATSIFMGRKLIERIEEKQAEMLKPLIHGQAADFPDYKRRAGYLHALEDVKAWIGEINAEEDDEGRGPFASSSSNPYSPRRGPA